MTRRELSILREVVRELMADDGDFNGAIGKLCKFTGQSYPAAKALRSIKQVGFKGMMRIARRPNQEFTHTNSWRIP